VNPGPNLIALGSDGATTTYAYGPFGERVSQTTASTTFIYPNKFYSIASSTGSGAKYATTTDYVYAGSNLFATVDQKLVSRSASGTPITRYNHTDNLGSTNVTSDATMNVAQWFDYAPYGSVIATTNTGATKAGRQYIGQFTDDSGLSYLNARYFNSGQGKFTTQDPAFLSLGNPTQLKQLSQQDQQQFLSDPQQMNAYGYGRGNPITMKDPSGNGFIGEIGVESLHGVDASGITYGATNYYYTTYGNPLAPMDQQVGKVIDVGIPVTLIWLYQVYGRLVASTECGRHLYYQVK
jgi:RHS repeat-associated protein